jgi:hypothetical protein
MHLLRRRRRSRRERLAGAVAQRFDDLRRRPREFIHEHRPEHRLRLQPAGLLGRALPDHRQPWAGLPVPNTSKRRRWMPDPLSVFIGFVLGAVVTFILDPRSSERRAKAVELSKAAAGRGLDLSRDVAHQARGVVVAARHRFGAGTDAPAAGGNGMAADMPSEWSA